MEQLLIDFMKRHEGMEMKLDRDIRLNGRMIDADPVR